MSGLGIEVITEDLEDHPHCPHGPTILFSRVVSGKPRNFFACAACRDRKDCAFFLWEDEKGTLTGQKQDAWQQEKEKFIGNINHKKLHSEFNKVIKNIASSLFIFLLMFFGLLQIRRASVTQRIYCHTCNKLDLSENKSEHTKHTFKEKVTNYELLHPSELLVPLDNPKKEAQFLFSKVAVKTIVDILANLQLK